MNPHKLIQLTPITNSGEMIINEFGNYWIIDKIIEEDLSSVFIRPVDNKNSYLNVSLNDEIKQKSNKDVDVLVME